MFAPANWTCTQCGAANPADVCLCSQCGALNYGSDEQDESASKRIKVDVAATSDPFPFALVGKHVAIQGLKDKAVLNGAKAVVKDFDFPSARYSVEVEAGLGTYKLKRENLRDLTAPAAQDPAQASPAQADANIGRTVEVQGLNARPELNGMRGVITELDAASGRYTVDIEGGVGAFKLKPDNLKDPTAAAPPPRHEIYNADGKGGPQGKGGGGLAPGQVVESINVSLMDKGAIIGSGGKQINQIRSESGAYVQIETSPVDSEMAVLTLRGSPEQLETAKKMVTECVTWANRPRDAKPVFQKKILDVPKPYVAGVIGKGGCFLKEMQEQSKCKIFFQLAVEHDPTAEWDKQVCILQGPPEQLAYAEQLVWAKVAEVSNSPQGQSQSWAPKTWEPAPQKKEVCKFFLQGFCGYGDKCTKAHEGEPAKKELCEHFAKGWCAFGDACHKLHDTASAAPKEVCPHFANGNCAFGDKCHKLHDTASVAPKESCPYFAKGTCTFGDACNKLHDAASVAPKEVCPHFASGNCAFGDKCYKLHENSQAQGGSSWNASGSSWNASGAGQANNGTAQNGAAWTASSPANTSWNAPSPADTSWKATGWNASDASSGQSSWKASGWNSSDTSSGRGWNASDASSGQAAGVPSMPGMPAMPSSGGWNAADGSSGQPAGVPAMPSGGGLRERLGVMGPQTSQQPSHTSAGDDGWGAQGWATSTMPAAFSGGTAPPMMTPPMMMAPPTMSAPTMSPPPMMSMPPGLSMPDAGGNAGWSSQGPADASWNTPSGSDGNASWSKW